MLHLKRSAYVASATKNYRPPDNGLAASAQFEIGTTPNPILLVPM